MPRPFLNVWTLVASASWVLACSFTIGVIFLQEESSPPAECKGACLQPRFEEVSRAIWTLTPPDAADLLMHRLQLSTPWIAIHLTDNQQLVETWGPCCAEWRAPQGDRLLWRAEECQLWPMQSRLEAHHGVCEKFQHHPQGWQKVWEVQGEQWEVDLANSQLLLSSE